MTGEGYVVRDLSRYEGTGRDRGRSPLVRALWLAASAAVVMRWWLPNSARIAILRRFGARIGTGCIVRPRVRIDLPWKLVMGEHSWLGEGVWIINPEDVSIGSNVCVSQDAIICSGAHDPHSETFAHTSRPVVIGDGVWIALRATVLSGVHVGDHATVRAGAVVAKNVPVGAVIGSRRPSEATRNS